MRSVPWDPAMCGSRWTHIIDVRSPAEYAQDHIPGAVNLPVLDDAQRAEIGTIYCQQSTFAARRIGAAMVARSIAAHLEDWFRDIPAADGILCYCWRGGQRSRALATVVNAVGWNVDVLSGGYKAYRSEVRETLASLGPRMPFRILAGLTGSGKSRLLRTLAATGEQVLDFEALGRHRGSLLGQEPGSVQPTQKAFESALLHAVRGFSLQRPVWVESESKRIGNVQIPEAFWQTMLGAPVHELVTPLEARVDFLVNEYVHFTRSPQSLLALLPALLPLHGRERLALWEVMIRGNQWAEFVRSLLITHYDPSYRRANRFQPPRHVHHAPDCSAPTWQRLAAELPRLAAAEG